MKAEKEIIEKIKDLSDEKELLLTEFGNLDEPEMEGILGKVLNAKIIKLNGQIKSLKWVLND